MTKVAEITFDQLLDCLPVRNESVQVELLHGGGLTLRIPFRKRWYMHPPFTWILPLGHERTMKLDKLGRQIWDMANGHYTTEKIIERFATEHHLSFHEARLSVTQFLQTLTEGQAVVIVGRKRVSQV